MINQSGGTRSGRDYPKRIIDETGRIWGLGDGLIERHLRTTLTGTALANYVVENLGWIEIGRPDDAITIRCRPALVSGRALGCLLYCLHDGAPSRYSLSVLGSVWQHTILRSKSEVATIITGMAQVSPIAGSAAAETRFIRKEIDPLFSPLSASATELQVRSRAARHVDELTPSMQHIFKGKWCICHVEESDVIMDRVGSGYTPFNPRWLQCATGLSLDRYADRKYGAWITSMREEVGRKRKAVFDNVDAIVEFPRLGPTRLRYARCTVPIQLKTGAQFVVSASRSDSSINLRGEA